MRNDEKILSRIAEAEWSLLMARAECTKKDYDGSIVLEELTAAEDAIGHAIRGLDNL